MLALLGLFGLAVLSAAFISSPEEEDLERGADSPDSEIADDENLEMEAIDIFLNGQVGAFANQQDTLMGKDGNDYIVSGLGDLAFGGAGADSFEVPTVGPAYVQDFEGDEGDRIIIPYTGNEPVIEFASMDHGTMILANGVAVAEVLGHGNIESSIKLVFHAGDN